nr:hypothetical protein [Rhodothermus marinus]
MEIGANGLSLTSLLDDRDVFVEQFGKHPDDARFGLAAQPEQDHVVPSQNGVLDLGNDGPLVADDAGKDLLAAPQFGDQVLAQLVLDRQRPIACLLQVPQRLQFGQHLSHAPVIG